MKCPSILALAIFFVPAALTQTVRIEPNIAIAESEYREAQDAWLHNDPSLANDLFSGKKDEILSRIHRAAGLRDDVMVKKDVYLGFILQRLGETRKRLAASEPGSTLPVDDIRKGLEQQQSHLLADQDRVESLLRDLPEGDEYSLVRRELEQEHSDLITLQNTLAMRLRSLDGAARAQQAIEQMPGKDPQVEKLDSVIAIWQQERERTARQRTTWAHYYSDMEQAVGSKKEAPAGKPSVSPPAPAGKPPKDKSRLQKPGTQPAESRASNQRGLNGGWIYRSESGAWAGAAEPQAASLDIQTSGKRIDGVYTARVPVRGETRSLNLTIEGKVLSGAEASLQWTSREPAAGGQLSLKLSPDGRLLLEIMSSDDSYVPRGMEVLSPR